MSLFEFLEYRWIRRAQPRFIFRITQFNLARTVASRDGFDPRLPLICCSAAPQEFMTRRVWLERNRRYALRQKQNRVSAIVRANIDEHIGPPARRQQALIGL